MSYIVTITTEMSMMGNETSVNADQLKPNQTVCDYVRNMLVDLEEVDSFDEIDEEFLIEFTFDEENDVVEFDGEESIVKHYKIENLEDLLK